MYDTYRAVSLVNIETRYDKYLSEASAMKCILFECTDALSFFLRNENRSFVKKLYNNIGDYINQGYVDFRPHEAIEVKPVRLIDVNKNTLANYLINAAYFFWVRVTKQLLYRFRPKFSAFSKKCKKAIEWNRWLREVWIACKTPHILFNHVTALQSAEEQSSSWSRRSSSIRGAATKRGSNYDLRATLYRF